MNMIQNDTQFKQALQQLDAVQQRVMAASIVRHVLPLSQSASLGLAVEVASQTDADDEELARALKTARSITFDSSTRCGADGNWTDQASYFVSRAVVAALTPLAQSRSGGPAWQAAMASRMAQTSALIDQDKSTAEDVSWQYDLITHNQNP